MCSAKPAIRLSPAGFCNLGIVAKVAEDEKVDYYRGKEREGEYNTPPAIPCPKAAEDSGDVFGNLGGDGYVGFCHTNKTGGLLKGKEFCVYICHC
jgi:hypothetical protein